VVPGVSRGGPEEGFLLGSGEGLGAEIRHGTIGQPGSGNIKPQEGEARQALSPPRLGHYRVPPTAGSAGRHPAPKGPAAYPSV
jgi:hypothetical protein